MEGDNKEGEDHSPQSAKIKVPATGDARHWALLLRARALVLLHSVAAKCPGVVNSLKILWLPVPVVVGTAARFAVGATVGTSEFCEYRGSLQSN